jgi:hypothetical protein
MVRRVGWQIVTDVSKDRSAFIFRVRQSKKAASDYFGQQDFRFRRSRKHPPKFGQILHFDIILHPGVKSLEVKSGHSQSISSLICYIFDLGLLLIANFLK